MLIGLLVPAHINNMYNTCFWSLVLKGGLTAQEANKELSVCRSSLLGSTSRRVVILLQSADPYSSLSGNDIESKAGITLVEVRYQLQFATGDVQKGQYTPLGRGDSESGVAGDRSATNNPVGRIRIRRGQNFPRSSMPFADDNVVSQATQGIVEISPPPEVPNGAASVPAKKIRVGKKTKTKRVVVAVHEDLINDAWWETGRGAGILS